MRNGYTVKANVVTAGADYTMEKQISLPIYARSAVMAETKFIEALDSMAHIAEVQVAHIHPIEKH